MRKNRFVRRCAALLVGAAVLCGTLPTAYAADGETAVFAAEEQSEIGADDAQAADQTEENAVDTSELFAAASESAAVPPLLTEGEYAGFYAISTAEQLAWFAQQVNGKRYDSSDAQLEANAVLTADIDLSTVCGADVDGQSISWTLIGWNGKLQGGIVYRGIFDGQGHTIRGLYYRNLGSVGGLFGLTRGTIRNLVLIDADVEVDGMEAGTVCGWNYGTIEHVTAQGRVSARSDAGGICGMNGGITANCVFAGTVEVSDTAEGKAAGGICGGSEGAVLSCVSHAAVTGGDAGGIAGTSVGVDGVLSYAGEVYANGVLYACINEGAVSGGHRAGGICGSVLTNSAVDGCENRGTVTAQSGAVSAGGLAGFCGGTVRNSQNRGAVCHTESTAAAKSCALGGVCGQNWGAVCNSRSSGAVQTLFAHDFAGGVCGTVTARTSAGITANCFAAGTLSGGTAGGVYGGGDAAAVQSCYYAAALADAPAGDGGQPVGTAAFDANGRLEAAAAVNGTACTVLLDALNAGAAMLQTADGALCTWQTAVDGLPAPTGEAAVVPMPTAEPTPAPTAEPTPAPTAAPTSAPTAAPTSAPDTDAATEELERQYADVYDYAYYLAAYADLAAAFGGNRAGAIRHYLACGMAEGRRANLLYDPQYYRAANPDLAAAFGTDWAALARHYRTNGMAEGRRACTEFSAEVYRANYADLDAAFGGDCAAYYRHYLAFGRAEGRQARFGRGKTGAFTVEDGCDYSVIFDAAYYAARYPDLRAAFGTDEAALLVHFADNGMAEGRRASADFDVRLYRARYADLRAAFGDDLTAYCRHYMRFGCAEGRTGAE